LTRLSPWFLIPSLHIFVVSHPCITTVVSFFSKVIEVGRFMFLVSLKMNVDFVSFFLEKKGWQFLEPSFATSCCCYVQHTNSSNLITFHAKLGYAMWSHVQSTCVQSPRNRGLWFCHLRIHPKLKKTKSAKWRIYFHCWKTICWGEYFEHNENKKKQTKTTRGCVTLWPWASYIKTYLKAKEELWKLKYFTMQKYNLQKIL
jgi:hypothetical protein